MITLFGFCNIRGGTFSLVDQERRKSYLKTVLTSAIRFSASSGSDTERFTSYRPQSSDISEKLIGTCCGGGV